MSNLLNKKPKIDRINTSAPSVPYNDAVEKPPEKFTSVRVSETMRAKLNAMIAFGMDTTVEKLLHQLTDLYINETFTEEEKEHFESFFEASRKRK